MSEPSEVLIFRDYSGWEEPALTTPFGFMSLRNIVVLGVFGMMAAVAYWATIPDNMDVGRDWMAVCAALSPLGIGLAFCVIKTQVGTADAVLLSVLVMLAREAGAKKRTKGRLQEKKRKRSKVLGFPRRLPVEAPKKDRIQEIICADMDELKSIRVTIYGGDGTVLGNRLVRCYLDDELVDTLRTSAEGSLVLHVRPEREGGRTLVVRGDKEGILMRKPLQFVHSKAR